MTTDPDRLLLTTVLSDGTDVVDSWAAWLHGTQLRDVSPDAHRVLPLATRNVRRVAPGTAIPELLRGLERHSWARNQLALRAAVPVLEELGVRGIPTMLLKGASLAPYYGDEWMHRVMYDFDVLVPVSRVHDTIEMFDELGWTPILGLSPETLRTKLLGRRHSWGMRSARGAELDLHWHAFAGSLGRRADDDLWAASEPLEFGGVTTRRMHDADLLLHVLAHGAHREPGSELQSIVDVVTILRSVPAGAVADRLARSARAHHLLLMVRESLSELEQLEPLGLDELVRACSRARPRSGERRLAQARADERRPGWITDVRHGLVRHGGGSTRLMSRVRGLWRERLDAGAIEPRRRWALHVALGRSTATRWILRRRAPVSRVAAKEMPRLPLPAHLDLSDPEALELHAGPGLTWCDPEGAWTDGAEVRLLLAVDEPERRDLHLGVELVPYLSPKQPRARVDVFVNERHLARRRFASGRPVDGVITVAVPSDVVRRRRALEVTLRFRAPRSMWLFGIAGDARRIGALLKTMWVAAA
jgi:hypothetical protein